MVPFLDLYPVHSLRWTRGSEGNQESVGLRLEGMQTLVVLACEQKQRDWPVEHVPRQAGLVGRPLVDESAWSIAFR